MKQDPIHVVITGGTIDSYFEATKDTVVPNRESVIPAYIKSLKLYNKITHTVVCMKDSRAILKKDREAVCKEIDLSKAKKFIVTHGTYTMGETARFITSHLTKGNEKTVVLTGSMIPLVGFASTDASFNLGFAFARVQDLAPGVYVAMNGSIFSAEEVTKLVDEGRFTSIFNQ